MPTKFSDFMAELRRDAEAEGPKAVAELEDFSAHFRLARELLARRRELRFSQAQLAARSGVPQSEVSRIERGSANPTLRTLSGLAGALGCSIGLVRPSQRSRKTRPTRTGSPAAAARRIAARRTSSARASRRER